MARAYTDGAAATGRIRLFESNSGEGQSHLLRRNQMIIPTIETMITPQTAG